MSRRRLGITLDRVQWEKPGLGGMDEWQRQGSVVKERGSPVDLRGSSQDSVQSQ